MGSESTQYKKGSKTWVHGKTKEEFPQLANGGRKKGCTPWNKGIKMSRDYREKCKKRQMGVKMPQATLEKMRKSAQTGSKNVNWKGGISKVKKLIRCLPEYKLWRSRVFQRDGWTCQTCGTNGCYLEAHHKKAFSKIVDENNIDNSIKAIECLELWDISNGVTLCRDCHDLTKLKPGAIDG